jgi:hypothetical protein
MNFTEEGSFQFLGVFDAISILLWLIILFTIVSSNYSKNQSKSHYRYYKNAFYAKFFSAIIFSIIYIINYQGGDSTAYWDSAQKLNNLFWDSPTKYFNEMFSMNPLRMRYDSFDLETGLPPNWIYKEDEAWFASKVFSLLSFLTFKSYFAMTMISAYISFRVSWLLYELILKFSLFKERIAAIGTLFIPSTCFWCTGITKDMIIYSCVIYLFTQFMSFFDSSLTKQKRNWILIVVSVFLIINIRDFMLLSAIGPFFMSIGSRWSSRQNSTFSKIFIQFLFISIIFFLLITFLGSEKGIEFTKEAEVIQNDLKTNESYGENRYDLGINDFSAIGMIRAMPISIFTAFYRPFVWEPGSLFIKVSAIEALFFLLLTMRLIFSGHLLKSFRDIRNHEMLMASLVFSLILGFFAGYTSGLFGVLVRFKAPLLPFLFLVLVYKKENDLPKKERKL